MSQRYRFLEGRGHVLGILIPSLQRRRYLIDSKHPINIESHYSVLDFSCLSFYTFV